MLVMFHLFFFFQAEDGIRDKLVTGVQTCALPIFPVALAEFDAVLGERPNQVARRRDDVHVTEEQLVDFAIPGSEITDEGLRVNVSVGVRYLDAWLQGVGAAAIDNLMEDAATAEISP